MQWLIQHGILLAFLISTALVPAGQTRLKTDEQIVFYPAIAQRLKGETNLWRAEIHGCVFAPEQRRLTLATLREALELKGVAMNAPEAQAFNQRTRLFLVDHERGKPVFIRLGANQTLARSNGAAFHSLSASLWQLYEPLAAFVRITGFPAGTFALKTFRWKDRSFFSLLANPEKYKAGVIEPLLTQCPERRFNLDRRFR